MNNKNVNNKYSHLFIESQIKDRLFEIQKMINKKNINSSSAFSILLPPPNVTGKLHLGHAWNVSIQDALIRFNALMGKDVYWICGMDHAGIATQTKYERILKEEGKQILSEKREDKINDLYKWSQINANSIREQWKKMGLFLDYDNEWFTLQKESNNIVNKTFVKMYNDNLIYRAKKLVNWDTKLQTAISNIEVIKKESETYMYTIKYYLENSDKYLLVATTRPETIFVDECLVVNPNDERYKMYVSKKVFNPLTKKLIPIIADEYVDKEFGTGIMKCTPAHDFNDYELGVKYKLDIVSCFNEDGTTNENAIGFENLSIGDCRSKVIKYFEENNLLEKKEKIISSIGYSERTGVVVEPMLSYQWFVSMKKYADKIIELQSTNKKVKFHPIKFEKMIINWLKNINDWCISRQLWWGHQIPVWYKKNSNEIYVDEKPPKNESEYIRETDVLDTWFSSGLWPVITSQNNRFFPTNVLVTAFDIIFFWVSRMMFFSLYLKNESPFKNVYITGLIRDSLNRKMSKSLGNGIDPNDVIENYGADSLRLFLMSSSSPGEDLVYSEQKVKAAWGFINKIWNSYKFIEKKVDKNLFDLKKIPNEFLDIDKWILNKFNETLKSYKQQFSKYNFLVAIKKIVDFTWNDFCNTYIELNKNRDEMVNSNLWILIYILKNILIMLHPICPFVTTDLYDKLNFYSKKNHILEDRIEENDIFSLKINDNFEKILITINRIRTFVFNNKIAKNKEIKIAVLDKKNNHLHLEEANLNILRQTKIFIDNNIIFNKNEPDYVETDFTIFILNKNELISNNYENFSFEKIQNEIDLLKKEIERCNGMLNNTNFMTKAPKAKIELEEEKRKKHIEKLEKLESLLKK